MEHLFEKLSSSRRPSEWKEGYYSALCGYSEGSSYDVGSIPHFRWLAGNMAGRADIKKYNESGVELDYVI